jgi:ABC-type multidrug transport system fused ATPase/permease subunit
VCPSTFFDFIQTTLFCLAAIALLCISLPWLLILVPLIYYLFVFLRTKYIKSSREIKRLEAISRSPIYADFSAALDGLNTLRAYKLEERITTSFYNQLDKNQRVWHSFLMVSRWLGFRLDFLCTFILIVMVFLSAAFKGTYDVGLIGFALVYTLSLSGLAQWSVRQSAEVENQMTAMERINTYAHLPAEDGYRTRYGEVGSQQQDQQQDQQSESLTSISIKPPSSQQEVAYTAATTSEEEEEGRDVHLAPPAGEKGAMIRALSGGGGHHRHPGLVGNVSRRLASRAAQAEHPHLGGLQGGHSGPHRQW